jgi:mRNA degradation ribonuclease J1/J2
MHTVYLVRLTSGEEILCNKQETPTSYILLNPTVIIPTQGKNIGLAPWLPYAKNERIELEKQFVVFITEPVEALAQQYNEIHSNIILPPIKGIVIPNKPNG